MYKLYTNIQGEALQGQASSTKQEEKPTVGQKRKITTQGEIEIRNQTQSYHPLVKLERIENIFLKIPKPETIRAEQKHKSPLIWSLFHVA